MSFNVAVAAGTSDASDLIKDIGDIYNVTAFVATKYGESILEDLPCTVNEGRLDEEGFKEKLQYSDAVVDATHPFAVEVSRILREVCKSLNLPYLRLERENSEYSYKKIIYVSSKEEAAEILSRNDGNILFTTGVNTLGFYETRVKKFKERCWARVLDTEESRKAAADISCNIIYDMPPFSYEDTLKLLLENNISIMVSKDSGKRGGIFDKLRAAERAGIPVVIIKRPDEQNGLNASQIKEQLKRLYETKMKRSDNMLNAMLKQIRPLDEKARACAWEKWDNIAKPLRSLGRLEEMVVQLAGITGSHEIEPRKKAVLIFCSDNGVVDENVTQCTNEVTAVVALNFTKGIASINSLSRVCGADVFPIDIGIARDVDCSGIENCKIAYGTKDFAKEPAMTREQAIEAILAGIEAVHRRKEEGYNLIVTGEMGIGNTTTSSAVLSVLEDIDPANVTGRGAGLTSQGILHKIDVIRKAIELHNPDKNDVIDVLSKVGGFDICGIMGAFLGGAIYRIPVLIDGFISAVAANCAIRLVPESKGYIFATHCSAEPAGKFALDAIGMKACLECNMCLGEGTGAVLGAKLFDFALAAYDEIADFDEAKFGKYEWLS